MKIYIVTVYDATSFGGDKRIEIKKIFKKEVSAKKYCEENPLKSSFMEYEVQEWDVNDN